MQKTEPFLEVDCSGSIKVSFYKPFYFSFASNSRSKNMVLRFADSFSIEIYSTETRIDLLGFSLHWNQGSIFSFRYRNTCILERSSKYKGLEVGDYVYPSYDAKFSRTTKVQVVKKTPKGIIVHGVFWGDETPTFGFFDNYGEGWIKYDSNPTLMELLGVTPEDEEGDFYMLQDREEIRRLVEEDNFPYHPILSLFDITWSQHETQL